MKKHKNWEQRGNLFFTEEWYLINGEKNHKIKNSPISVVTGRKIIHECYHFLKVCQQTGYSHKFLKYHLTGYLLIIKGKDHLFSWEIWRCYFNQWSNLASSVIGICQQYMNPAIMNTLCNGKYHSCSILAKT